MATVFRDPLITRFERAYPSAAAQAQPWRGSNIALLTVVVAGVPIIPMLWPNPYVPPMANSLRTWFNFQTTPITTPVMGFDWVNTRSFALQRPQEYPPNVALLGTTPAVLPAGFRSALDQPNPQRPDRFGVYRAQSFPNFTVLPQPNTQPFTNFEWPVPVGPMYSVALRIFSTDIFIGNRLPPPGVAGSWNTLSISILAAHRIGF